MKPERSKELRDYLQKMLGLPSTLPDPEEDPEFEDKLYHQLMPHYGGLLKALDSAFPSKESLQWLVEQELGIPAGKIPDGRSYEDKLLYTIKWMESDGCLLEFMAASHKLKPNNPPLNLFVKKTFKNIVQSLLFVPQSPQPEATPPPELAPFVPAPSETHNGGNSHGASVSKGAIGGDVGVVQFPLAVEPDQEQLIQFPSKAVVTDHQPGENLPVLARKRTQAAQEKMQKIYDMFQNSEKISDPHVINSIKEVEETLEGISNLFDDIPIPDYPELDCRLASEERYITQRVVLIRIYAQRDVNVHQLPGDLQKANGEFKKFFSSLGKLENLIDQYQQQMQL